MKIKSLLASLLVLAAPLSLPAAVTLEQADSLWLFDGAASGNATAGQIVDSSANGHTVSSVANLAWTNVPTTGPAGGATQGTPARGLDFSPVLVDGTANPNTVSSAHFIASNATVSGSSTMITRLRWDGLVTNDGTTPWIINNGLGGWTDPDGTGALLGSSQGYMFGLTTGGNLTYYTAGSSAGHTASGAVHSFSTNSLTSTDAGSSILSLTANQWYDVAMVIDDLGDTTQNTTKVTFYLVGPDGVLKTFSRSTNIWGNVLSASNLIIGTESTGTGTGNSRKTFNGVIDYLAMFDTALTQQEIAAIFAVPEPSRALLLLCGMALVTTTRRRRR